MEELKIVEVEEVKQTQLIIVKQLPIIEQHLKALKEEVSIEVATAKALVCTADTIQSVKKTKSGLAKKFKALEVMRKEVKSKVMNPYQDFEKIYKECVTDQFEDADSTLKVKIAEVEDEVKAQKKADVKAYFEEYISTTEIDFIEFERANIKVRLSNSLKSLKAEAKTFIDAIESDLILIRTQEHKADIIVEYKQSLNCSLAITTVVDRFKKIEEEKERQVELQKKRDAEKARQLEIEAEKKAQKERLALIQNAKNPKAEPMRSPDKFVPEFVPEEPVPFEEAFAGMFNDEEPKIEVNFTIQATSTMMDELIQFLNERKYEYKSEVM